MEFDPMKPPTSQLDVKRKRSIEAALLLGISATLPVFLAACSKDRPAEIAKSYPPVDPVRNKIAITGDGRILWNGAAVSTDELAALLRETTQLEEEPALQFQPEADASYEVSAKVLNIM